MTKSITHRPLLKPGPPKINTPELRRVKQAAGHLRRKFGLTPEQWQEIAEAQGYACKLCGEKKRLATDHSHSNGKVRGLLCWNCNSGMGKFKHNPALLRAAADYIETCRK
jgi:hypothetical protein